MTRRIIGRARVRIESTNPVIWAVETYAAGLWQAVLAYVTAEAAEFWLLHFQHLKPYPFRLTMLVRVGDRYVRAPTNAD